jgi:hypothetical protein
MKWILSVGDDPRHRCMIASSRHEQRDGDHFETVET